MRFIFIIIFIIFTLILNTSCANMGRTQTTYTYTYTYTNPCTNNSDCDDNEFCSHNRKNTCNTKLTGVMNSKHKKIIKTIETQNSNGLSNTSIALIVFGVITLVVTAILIGFKGGVTQCCDGTTSSSTGQGTCSHHGGVC